MPSIKWKPHKDVLRRMYVDEERPVDEIVEYLRKEHNLDPGRRALTRQFSFWGFPARYKRAWTSEVFCTRLRELWEQNVKAKEMLKILQEEGHDVELRHVTNARRRLGLKLRHDLVADEDGEEDRGGSNDDDGEGNEEGEGSAPLPPPPMDPEEARQLEERRIAFEQQRQELWATKKRRRHTRSVGGVPADPPGPPRYPSEMTITEAKAILQLDDPAVYKTLREQFVAMHTAEGSFRKAHNQVGWQALTDKLIRENMHLRAVMWDPEGMEEKRRALDVICQSSRKMAKESEQNFGAPMALRVLGLNPIQGSEARTALHMLLVEYKFTSVRFDGPERWAEIKRRWIAGYEPLAAALARDGTDEEHKLREKAVKVFAKDVCGRYGQEVKKNGGRPLDIAAVKALKVRVNRSRGAGAPSKPVDQVQPPKQVDQGQPPKPVDRGEPAAKRPRGRPRKSAQPSQPAPIHTQSRLLPPDDDYDMPSPPSPAGSMSPMDDDHQLDPSLMDTSQQQQQNPFLNDQYIQGVLQAATRSDPPVLPLFTHQQPLPPAPAPAPIPTTTASGFAPAAVYFRLHPTSSMSVAAPALWISTLTTPSVGELRDRAVNRFGAASGVMCVGLEGLIKDPGGGDAALPLPVSDDGELVAYLEHVRGTMAPTFRVTLVEGGRGWA